MSDPTPPNSTPPTKPAIQSTTVQGAAVAIAGGVFVLAPIVTAVVHGQPVTLDQVVEGIGAVATILGAAGAIYGRFKAIHPIAGLFRTPTQ